MERERAKVLKQFLPWKLKGVFIRINIQVKSQFFKSVRRGNSGLKKEPILTNFVFTHAHC